jgi:hypothetical protein
LDENFRQIVRGYAITSYASQGKSVNYVLFSDSALKGATNNQQWYVTISRGKKGIQIFTTDKPELRENITRSGDRPLASDIIPATKENVAEQTASLQVRELLRQHAAPRVAKARGVRM